MSYVITFLNRLVSALLWPFSFLPSWWGLFLVSAISGVVLLWFYGKISNQAKIKSTKSRIYAHLLESVLFRNNVWLTLRAQFRMFLAGGRYFTLAVFPVLILLVPCLFLLAEINQRYGYEGFAVSEPAVLELQLEKPELLYQVKLESSEALELSPPVRVPETNQIFWRITANSSESQGGQAVPLSLQVGEQTITKNFYLSPARGTIDAVWSSDWLTKLLYPAGPAEIPNVKSLVISYPERLYSLGLWESGWLVFFLIFSMITGIVVSRFIGVEI